MNNEINYELKSTGESSAKFGACECCGKHVSDVFIMTAKRKYKFTHNSVVYFGEAYVSLPKAFGHESCLKSEQQ